MITVGVSARQNPSTKLYLISLKDPTIKNKFSDWSALRRTTLRWSCVADKLDAALNSVHIEDREGSEIASKIVIVGCLPPGRSGISTYNREVISHLNGKLVGNWIVSHGNVPVGLNEIVLPLPFYNKNWRSYDKRLCIIGNSFHHLESLATLNKYGGGVWLHDVRLSGLAWNYANQINSSDPWGEVEKFHRAYNKDLCHNYNLHEILEGPISFARPLLRNAVYFIVHSDHAKSLLQDDLGGYEDQRPIYVIPHAIKARDSLDVGHNDDKFAKRVNIVIGLLGFMASVRAPEALINAVYVLKARGVDCAIRVIGHCSEIYMLELIKQCQAFGIIISFSGYTTEDGFIEEVRAIDVAVQLRRTTNGESSGTVATAISLCVR